LHEIGEVSPDDPGPAATFGISLALDGHRLVVGDVGDPNGDFIGAAYVFRLDDDATPWDLTDDDWIQEAKLSASDGSFGRHFGNAVAIAGDWIVVGDSLDDDWGIFSGSAYMFRHDDGGTPSDMSDDGWVEHQKLTASDAAPDALFGATVSIDGDWLVVGAPQCARGIPCSAEGSAYIFRHDDNATPAELSDDSWVEHTKLQELGGSAPNGFGRAVSILGDRIAVGCPGNDDVATNAGAVFVFLRDDNSTPMDQSDDSWLSEVKLAGLDADASDRLGLGVAMSVDTIAAGAILDEQNGVVSGSAYVFQLDDAGTPWDAADDSWSEVAKLVPSDGQDFDAFGEFISIGGSRILVGARYHNGGAPGSGAAYLFRRDGASWVEGAKFIPREAGEDDQFGRAVALDGNRAFVGAPFRDEPGAVHVFPTSRDCLSLRDFASFQDCFGAEAIGACEAIDFQPNGVIDLVDYRQLIVTLTGP